MKLTCSPVLVLGFFGDLVVGHCARARAVRVVVRQFLKVTEWFNGHITPGTVRYIGVMHMSRCAGPEIAFPFVVIVHARIFFIILVFWEYRVVRERE